MKLLITFILFIIFSNFVQSSSITQSYISNINGTDSITCGQSIESPCYSIQGSLISLQNEYSNDESFPYYYQVLFYFYPSTYTTNSTINMDGYNAIFQPYPNIKGTVYFNGNGNGYISPTWFTSTLNNNLNLTFNNIKSSDCRVSNGYNSFLFGTNSYSKPSALVNFNNCNFNCQNGFNVPIISVSNGTTLIQDYSDLSSQYQINFNICSFGYNFANITINNPFIYTNVPVALSLESCNFININSTSKSSLIVFNNGILSIQDAFIYSMVEVFILQSNNSKITLDSITDDVTGSKYDNGMLILNNALFSFMDLKFDVSMNNDNLVSLMSIDNSFGSFESSYITTFDFIFNKNSYTSNCSNTYLINSDTSNIYFIDNYLNGCGPAIYASSSVITVNDNTFPYLVSDPIDCDENTVTTFSGSDTKQLNISNCFGPVKKGLVIGLVILSVAVATLIIAVIVLLKINYNHRHNTYASIQ